MSTTGKHAKAKLPRDAHLIISLLQTMGISDWEPRVVNQLLEFTHRKPTAFIPDAFTMLIASLHGGNLIAGYVGELLDDAKVYSKHAGKTKIVSAAAHAQTHAVLPTSLSCCRRMWRTSASQ
eukprot:SAG31_NODE_4165_length_3518_cov_5.005850_2_plen_122_part_00